ncbi:hypothetical protein PF005_g14667 [Phytophthora fragariae]|nr:hypothetical protein PF011_g6702 [Phytophthora fragariae]KAE9202176.1 hypothetical protein PF005_g14667 [Phytophthora fragariae]KAE9256842.1 hypothetical protein PF002_g1595 [Phytophthora fragariae]
MTTLEDGSTSANFSSDFSPSASLPPASIKCASYEDILDALHGLNSLGQEVWYDHMRKLTSRLRNFVAKNKSADPDSTPTRVRLTLLYVNKFIGSALGFMQLDDPQWWSGFSEALRAIDYQSPVWTMALASALSQPKSEGGEGIPTKTRRNRRASGKFSTRASVLPSLDANTASMLGSRKDSTGTGAARTVTSTLRFIAIRSEAWSV